jgi:RNA polymerase-binding transcription factor DksA
MADIIDQAQQHQLRQISIQHHDYSLPSLSECEECGNDIPPERQKYGAVTLCIECQTNLEQKRNLYK